MPMPFPVKVSCYFVGSHPHFIFWLQLPGPLTRPTPRRRCQHFGSLSCGGHAGLHRMHAATCDCQLLHGRARPDPAVVLLRTVSPSIMISCLSSSSNHWSRPSGRNLNSSVLLLSTRRMFCQFPDMTAAATTYQRTPFPRFVLVLPFSESAK